MRAQIEDKGSKRTPNFFSRIVCKKLSKVLHSWMKKCEFISGESKIIEQMQRDIQSKVNDAHETKEELFYMQEEMIDKDEYIKRLFMLINHLGVNFREGNFEEVDKTFKKINL